MMVMDTSTISTPIVAQESDQWQDRDCSDTDPQVPGRAPFDLNRQLPELWTICFWQ